MGRNDSSVGSACLARYQMDWKALDIDHMNFALFPKWPGLAPREFLKFAIEDVACGDRHGYINGLSNAKRAIDCQADRILFAVGLKNPAQNFPSKLESVASMGLTTPGILKRINQKRNLLEHEYAVPTGDAVNDAIDAASLFIDATEFFLNTCPMDVAVGNPTTDDWNPEGWDPCVTVRFEPQKGEFQIATWYCCAVDPLPDVSQRILKHDAAYTPLIRLFASVLRQNDIEGPLSVLANQKEVRFKGLVTLS